MNERYYVRNAAGEYLRQTVSEEWTRIREEATTFPTLAEAEAARQSGSVETRSLWDESGRQMVARQVGGIWFATPVRGVPPPP